MSQPLGDTPARRYGWTGTLMAVWLTIGVAVALTAATGASLAGLPGLPGRRQPDELTGLVVLVGDLAARLAGAATLGLLAAVVVFLPVHETPDPEPDEHLRRWVVRSAQVWLAASVVMTFANPSFIEGMAITDSLRPDAWWLFLTSTTSDLAWVASCLVALATVAVGRWGRRRAVFLLAWLAGAVVTVFVAVTGGVSVGLDHDWATDAVGLATLASVVLSSGAIGSLLATAVNGHAGAAAIRRYHRALPPLLAVMAVGYGVGAWQQLAGVSLLRTVWGIPALGGFGILALLLGSWLWRQLAGSTRSAGRRSPTGSVARDVVLLILGMTSLTATTYLNPPRFVVPQTIQVNYLGYEVNLPATLERLAGLGRPNLLWVALSLVAGGLYVWGVVRVVRGGGRWPVSRLLFWLGGWGLTLYLAVSGLWMYSTAVFSWHMLVHMTVNMMVPVLCVLGAPLSLLAAASRPRSPGDPIGVQELVDGLYGNRLVRTLVSPPLVWANYVGSLFVVYFGPLFPWLMRYHWGHQLMLLHFMVAGYAFFALLVGPDRHPWQLPYMVRFALLLSIMPFHAIFAVGVMTSHDGPGRDVLPQHRRELGRGPSPRPEHRGADHVVHRRGPCLRRGDHVGRAVVPQRQCGCSGRRQDRRRRRSGERAGRVQRHAVRAGQARQGRARRLT